MKAIAENLYQRGKRGMLYIRCRIPADVNQALPSELNAQPGLSSALKYVKRRDQNYVIVSLGTSDLKLGRERYHDALSKIFAEFNQIREAATYTAASYAPKRISQLDDSLLENIASYYVQLVLQLDQDQRVKGLDDEEFIALGEKLTTQYSELRQYYAQGKSMRVSAQRC